MARNPVGFAITDPVAGWKEADFDDVFIRKDCFLEGGLWLWGVGGNSQLGNNSTINQSSPVQTVSGGTNWKQVSIGIGNSAAIKTDGSLWAWGNNVIGTVGNGNTISRSSPVQTVSGGTDWKKVSVGDTVVAAIKTDGSLWLWGRAGFGTLGNNSITDRSSPVQTVSSGTNWKQVSAGGNTGRSVVGAIKTDGTLWLWGGQTSGSPYFTVDSKIGDNTTTSKSSPVQTISGGTNWKQISVGGIHTGAIKTDGTLWMWGSNVEKRIFSGSTYTYARGSLGDNSIIDRLSPVQTIAGGTNWKQVSLGATHTTAIKTDGTLWLWGYGFTGNLGNNSIIDRSSPVQTVSGGTNWKSASGSCLNTVAIKTDGTLWVWGPGVGGLLGNNNAINRSSPVQTISGGTNWRSVGAGQFAAAAIREDCW